jgi:peptidoglycan/xylan/chitin deacetylase (PgdA/CDA1 family)
MKLSHIYLRLGIATVLIASMALSLFPGISVIVDNGLHVVSLGKVHASTTLDLQIDDTTNDAQERGTGDMTVTGGVQIRQESSATAASQYWGAYRVPATISQGSTIDEFWITPYAESTSVDDANFKIYCQKAAAPGAFSATAYDISGRTLTTAYVEWAADGVGAGYHDSPELKTVLQEVVNAYNVTYIVIILKPNTDVDKQFDSTIAEDGASYALKVHIKYSAGYVAPTLTSNLPTVINSTNATLSGNVTGLGGDSSVNMSFLYGTSPDSLSTETTPVVKTEIGNVTTNITSLAANTTYYFRAKGVNLGGTTLGTIRSFNTGSKSANLWWGTSTNITTWKSLKTAASHSVLWTTILAWADAHISDSPPADFVSEPDWSLQWATSGTIQQYIDTMVFVYRMTDDVVYASAAETWMNAITAYTSWNDSDTSHFTYARMIMAASTGVDGLADYSTSANHTAQLNKLIQEASDSYALSSLHSNVDYPNMKAYSGAPYVVAGIVTANATMHAYGEEMVSDCLAEMGTDGAEFEGSGYASQFIANTAPAIYASSINGTGTDFFTTYDGFLSHFPTYVMETASYNGTRLVLEDTSPGLTIFDKTDMALSFMYLLAGHTSNTTLAPYYEYYAEQHSKNRFMWDYIWKSSTLEASATGLTGMPLYVAMPSMGYVFVRDGWNLSTDLLIIFKSGTSRGHAQPAQNSYAIWNNGVMLTGGPGYTVSYDLFDETWAHNSILVDTANITEPGGLWEAWSGGQAQEGYSTGSDYGSVENGAKGVLQQLADSTNYTYARGFVDNSLYTNNATAHTSIGYVNGTGDLTSFTRHFVVSKNPYYAVVFDTVSDSSGHIYSYVFNGRDNEGVGSSLTYNGTTKTFVSSSVVTTNNVTDSILLPSAPATSIKYNNGVNSGRPFYLMMVSNNESATSAQFLNVLNFDDTLPADSATRTLINQGNCVGVKVDYTGNITDLILFSSDGNAVNQEIELSGLFAPLDGNSYTFNGTKVVAIFDDYAVIRLAETGGVTAPTITTQAASSVEETTATLNANLTNNGGEDSAVTFYWGDTDGGTNPTAWSHNATPTLPAQPQSTGVAYCNITGLTAGSVTFFTASATNSAGTSWPASTLVSSNGTQIQSFDTLTDWTSGAGAQAINTVDFKDGVASLSVISTSGVAAYSTAAISSNLSTTPNLDWWVYVPNTDNLSSISLYLSSVTNLAKYHNYTINSNTMRNGWNHVVLDKSLFSVSGGDSWDDLQIRLRVRVTSTASNTANISWDDMRYGYTAGTRVILTFDDGYDGVYSQAYPIMEANGQQGTVFVPASYIGTSGKMTLSNLTTLYNDGWDISNHTYNHINLTTVDTANATAEINNSYNWLVSGGFTRSAGILAYPFGGYNSSVITLTKVNGYMSRTTILGNFEAHATLDGNEEYQLKARSSGNTTTPATVESWIDQVINQNSLLILTFHNIVSSSANDTDKYLTSDFQTISNYLSTKQTAGLLQVETLSEYYSELVGTRYFTADEAPAITAPTMQTDAASSITSATAVLNGRVIDAGGENPTVDFYYGLTDGGTDPGSWDSTVSMGAQGGIFSTTLSGLTDNKTYYYTVRGVNSEGTDWGDTESFITDITSSSSSDAFTGVEPLLLIVPLLTVLGFIVMLKMLTAEFGEYGIGYVLTVEGLTEIVLLIAFMAIFFFFFNLLLSAIGVNL